MRNILARKIKTLRLPALARSVYRADHRALPGEDPGPDRVIEANVEWLCNAQDHSVTQDGGVAKSFSLVSGWTSSYPETTGYIVPTLLQLSDLHDRDDLRVRAKAMLDWFADIQLPGGGYQGGRVDMLPVVPVTFNTGQILLGLAAGVKEFDQYQDNMHKAARFLRDSLDPDGCWRKFPTPFAKEGDKAYETHVSWGLFEADRVAPGKGYAEAALKQVDWAISRQEQNGWVRDCCLTLPQQPLTHTLGYFLRGVLEAYKWSEDPGLLDKALLTARGLQSTQRADGSLPGRLNSDWTPAVSWSCLTGNVQVAASWLELAELCQAADLRASAISANSFVRRTVDFDGPPGIRGGVKGSFPVDGLYGEYEYLNWAAKFSIDSNLLELGQKNNCE